MKLKLYKVNAFAKKFDMGNPAGVCPLDSWLDDSIMQSVAKENGFSETAFFVKKGEEYDLRWFTPGCEVNLCGHGTLGTAYVVSKELGDERPRLVFNTRSGKLFVDISGEGFTLDMPAQPPVKTEAPEVLLKGVQAKPSEILRAEDYLLVFDDEALVRDMKPDFKLIRQMDLRGAIVTAPGNLSGVDFVSRWFGGRDIGIDEDPATGSAHTALAPYWAGRLNKTKLKAKQLSARGADLSCEYLGDRVKVGGSAVLYFKGEIFI